MLACCKQGSAKADRKQTSINDKFCLLFITSKLYVFVMSTHKINRKTSTSETCNLINLFSNEGTLLLDNCSYIPVVFEQNKFVQH